MISPRYHHHWITFTQYGVHEAVKIARYYKAIKPRKVVGWKWFKLPFFILRKSAPIRYGHFGSYAFYDADGYMLMVKRRKARKTFRHDAMKWRLSAPYLQSVLGTENDHDKTGGLDDTIGRV